MVAEKGDLLAMKLYLPAREGNLQTAPVLPHNRKGALLATKQGLLLREGNVPAVPVLPRQNSLSRTQSLVLLMVAAGSGGKCI